MATVLEPAPRLGNPDDFMNPSKVKDLGPTPVRMWDVALPSNPAPAPAVELEANPFRVVPRSVSSARCTLLLLAVTLGFLLSASAQHAHLNCGAVDTRPGSPLFFENAATFLAESGFVVNMSLGSSGNLAGLYNGSITLIGLAIDPFNGGPEPGHALPGTRITAVVQSLEGPDGSTLSFWESDQCEDFGPGITFTLPVGESNGTNSFLVSQNEGRPGEDPYGHCHGRRFTTTRPGLHKLGIQLVDRSTNGPGGGPVHSPSEIGYLYFQAGITLAKLERTDEGMAATFGTKTGSTFHLESSHTLDDPDAWVEVGSPVRGNNRLQTVVDPEPPGPGAKFYRLRVTTP